MRVPIRINVLLPSEWRGTKAPNATKYYYFFPRRSDLFINLVYLLWNTKLILLLDRNQTYLLIDQFCSIKRQENQISYGLLDRSSFVLIQSSCTWIEEKKNTENKKLWQFYQQTAFGMSMNMIMSIENWVLSICNKFFSNVNTFKPPSIIIFTEYCFSLFNVNTNFS